MASGMKVDQLRTELSKRGLDATGTKPFLVKRLEEALLKEGGGDKLGNDHDAGDINANFENNTNKKRGRENEDEDEEGSNKTIKVVEEFRQMNVKQLREKAKLGGLSTSGTKKEILKRLRKDAAAKKLILERRLCEDADKNHPPLNEDDGIVVNGEKEEDSTGKVEKMVTVTKKGAAVLDEGIKDHIKANYHVLKEGDAIYDVTLNQTNVGNNTNKYFVIQLLESDDYTTYMVHNRSGRVGRKGRSKLDGPYTAKEIAVRAFERMFYVKTKNYWCNRMDFVWHPGCYTWLEMDYDGKEKESADVKKKTDSSIGGVQPRENKLEQRVANFISLICNINMRKQKVMEIGYNADKLPLGKLSKSTISKGHDVLKRIANVIGQSNRTNLEQLNSEFYSVIPHDVGHGNMCELLIDTPQKLNKKLEMVKALGEIKLATKLLMDDDPKMEEDRLHHRYQQLHCELIPLDNDSEEFAMIAKYAQNTNANTPAFYTPAFYAVDIAQIFKVAREGETERFKKFSATKNRMLLWHGSRLTNWTGILSQGLRIAPHAAARGMGSVFRRGVFFADMFSTSANYCFSYPLTTTGALLLCEVALGDMAELPHSAIYADKLPEGKLSAKCVGATAPDPSESQTLDDGVIVPLGKPKPQQPMGTLPHNEYIVYNEDQIRMRYLVQVNFIYSNQLSKRP